MKPSKLTVHTGRSGPGRVDRRRAVLVNIHNTLARLVASHAVPRGTHSSDILQHLHWLPIKQRIKFKLATLTHTASYTPLNLLISALDTPPTLSLHSANTNLLSVPHVCTTFASRCFSVASPTATHSVTAAE